jgi:putative ABC transport system permease protein
MLQIILPWESYEDIINRDEIKWSVPISLGDSHKGFRVMGTNADFFKRYKYRGDRSLKIEEGKYFVDLYDVVIGFGVAEKLGYNIKHTFNCISWFKIFFRTR